MLSGILCVDNMTNDNYIVIKKHRFWFKVGAINKIGKRIFELHNESSSENILKP